MAALMPQGKQQYFTAGGIPLVGGKVYTYAAGTTTPLATYTTPAASTPNANPVILDSRGEASIFFSAANYKIVVKDSLDSTIWTQDNLPGDQAATILANLAASTGSSLVGHIASGTGAVATTVQRKLRESVSVLDFGAVGDGVTDDTAAIQSAVTALPSGATLLFPPGTYKLTASVLLAGKTNITLLGYGTTIQCGTSRIESYFNIDSSSAINVFGFIFDAKMQSMPLYTPADYANVYNCGAYVYNTASNILIRDCVFLNLYTVGAYFRGSSFVRVEDCRFESPTQTQTQMLQFLQFQTSSSITVSGCSFENAVTTGKAANPCGIFASGITKFITIDKCSFNYCGRDNTGSHRLGVIDFYYDVDNVSVTNCVSKNTMAEFMRLSTCDTGIVSYNQIEMHPNCEVGVNVLSLQSGAVYVPTANTKCKRITISNNIFKNDLGGVVELAIGVFAYDWGAYSENISIVSNICSDIKRMVHILGPFSGIKVLDNQSVSVSGSTSGIISAAHMPGMLSNYGVESASYFTDLDVSGNSITSAGQNGFIELALTSITTTAFVGRVSVSRNTLDCAVLSGSVGLSVDFRSTVPGNTSVEVSGNFVQRYNYGFVVNNCGHAVLEDNNSAKNTNYLIQGGNLSFNASGNKTRNGSLFGRSKLAGGSVTVLGSDCNNNDDIMVSHFDNSGVTLGTLYLANIGNGIFDIKSTSVTDDANVVWHVIH